MMEATDYEWCINAVRFSTICLKLHLKFSCLGPNVVTLGGFYAIITNEDFHNILHSTPDPWETIKMLNMKMFPRMNVRSKPLQLNKHA